MFWKKKNCVKVTPPSYVVMENLQWIKKVTLSLRTKRQCRVWLNSVSRVMVRDTLRDSWQRALYLEEIERISRTRRSIRSNLLS